MFCIITDGDYSILKYVFNEIIKNIFNKKFKNKKFYSRKNKSK